MSNTDALVAWVESHADQVATALRTTRDYWRDAAKDETEPVLRDLETAQAAAWQVLSDEWDDITG